MKSESKYLGSKCHGSKCLGSNCYWGANVRGANVPGAIVWGAPFMEPLHSDERCGTVIVESKLAGQNQPLNTNIGIPPIESCGIVPIPNPFSNLSGSERDEFELYGTGLRFSGSRLIYSLTLQEYFCF